MALGSPQLEKFLAAEKTRRRHRVLAELAKILKTRAHLALPAVAKFWRVDHMSKRLEDDLQQARVRKG